MSLTREFNMSDSLLGEFWRSSRIVVGKFWDYSSGSIVAGNFWSWLWTFGDAENIWSWLRTSNGTWWKVWGLPQIHKSSEMP